MTNHPSESARGLAGDTGGTFDSQDHMPLLIDADEAAAELSLGARTLWTLTNSNAIPSRKSRGVSDGPRSGRSNQKGGAKWAVIPP